MSIASSSSSLTGLRAAIRPAAAVSRKPLTTYTPSRPADDISLPIRPPRPSVPTFFSGRPTYHSAIESLESSLRSAQASLRSTHIYPLPSSLPAPQPPATTWHPAPILSGLLGTQLRTNSHRRVLDLLNELHLLRHIAGLADQPRVSADLDTVLARYERSEGGRDAGKQKEKSQVDQWGRAYGTGRRKESSARVWIVPSISGRRYLDTESTGVVVSETSENCQSPSEGEILVNHVPLSQHFPRITDREAVIRPLRLSGLLGAFNVFALAKGGGVSGQAGAVSLALARALVVMREETEEVLRRDGALMRDTRMVERKKTGNAKARKKNAWVKR